jgi:L-fuconate dehydratase
MIEWIDHLHQHFEEPAQVRAGRYVTPRGAGAGTAMRAEALARFSFPDGPAWRPGPPEADGW